MLVIRDSQMNAFVARFLEEFEDRRVREIEERFPSRYAALGEAGTRALIRAAIQKSRHLGIHGEEDVENLIDLTVVYGESFDQNEEFAFEAEPLRDEELPADARVSLSMARFGREPGFREQE
jgi:hypothetical protein